jgi:hypothetical protein
MRERTATKDEVHAGGAGRLPGLAVIAALVVCKGLLYGTALLAVIGIAVDIPPGPWAVAVDIAVVGATVAFWFNRRRHGMIWPSLIAALGAVLVIGRMHGQVPEVLEWTGLGLLVVAALLDWKPGRRPAG